LKNLFFTACIVLFGLNAIAFKSDTLYIKPYRSHFSLRLYSGLKELSFKIYNGKSDDNAIDRIIYKPNNSVVCGVGFSIKNLLLSLTTKLPGTDLRSDRFGKTDISDYQLNLTLRYLHISLYHRYYDGFYISNTSKIDPDFANIGIRIIRPDVNYLTKGFETIVSLNPKRYSLNASFKMTEQQVRNVWAGLVYANITSVNISGDSTLVPYNLQSNFSSQDLMKKGDYFGGAIQPGITYSYTFGKFFINPMFFAGLGYIQKKIYIVGNGFNEYNDIYFRMSSRINFGYNSNWFFTGFTIEWNNSFLPNRNLSINTSNFNVMMMGGFRF